MNTLPEKICKLLGQGIESSRVAAAVGCDPSYISQLLSDHSFAAKVQEYKLTFLAESTARDRRYDKLEDKMLDIIERDVDNNPVAFKSTSEKIRNLVLLNGMKRRGTNADVNPTSVHNMYVQLNLSGSMLQKFIKEVRNADNQVVKVGDRDLISMQSSNLNNLIGEHNDPEERPTSKISFYE